MKEIEAEMERLADIEVERRNQVANSRSRNFW